MSRSQQIAVFGTSHLRDWLESDAVGQSLLERVAAQDGRVLCMCRAGGVEMYVAHRSKWLIARMPGTCQKHDVACPSYSLPESMSGRAWYAPSAIMERDNGSVKVNNSFVLSRYADDEYRASSMSVEIRPSRVSLKGLLHLLWEMAGFNQWSPKMIGKRNWGIVRFHVLDAARAIDVKGANLYERFFVPAQFDSTKADVQEKQAVAFFERFKVVDSERVAKMFLILGQIKSIEAAKFGHRIMFLHMPKFPLWIHNSRSSLSDEAKGQCLESGIGAEGEGRALMLALVECASNGSLRVNDAAFMRLNKHWIPLLGEADDMVAARLIGEQRRFQKPMTFDTGPQHCGVASFVLTDCEPMFEMFIASRQDLPAYPDKSL